jgi:hypothetical protein
MPTIVRPGGRVLIEAPAGVTVEPVSAPSAARAKARRLLTPETIAAAGTPSASAEILLAAMANQGLAVDDQFRVVPRPAPKRVRRSAGATAAAGPIDVTVDTAADEDSVLLVERDGVLSWDFGTAETPPGGPVGTRAAVGTRRRRGGGTPAPAPASAKRRRFRIDLGPAPPPPRKARARRNPIVTGVLRAAKVYIIKFAAGVAAEQSMAFLERHVRKGLVVMNSDDPAGWRRVDDASALKLPSGRPARVLLFIHGTFSSTAGSFGPLGATPWGRAFLAAARAQYDAVIGFDHATLSEDPRANAEDLLGRLRALRGARPQLDVITYSRGGLVFRSLVDDVLPGAGWAPGFGEVVFVAVPNAGTLLAKPANWNRLADLVTNLGVAGCTAVSLVSPAWPAPAVLAEVIQGVGAFVKYLVGHAVTDGAVPGLAAMDPDGAFVRALQAAGGGAMPGVSFRAISSEYVDGGDGAIGARLVKAMAEGIVAQLMREANDLVVNTRSMTAFSAGHLAMLKDGLAFGKTPELYHLIYFLHTKVCSALALWLGLPDPVVAAASAARRAPARRGEVRTRRIAPERPSAAVVAAAARRDLPAAVESRAIVVDASQAVGDVLRATREEFPEFVVIRKLGGTGRRDPGRAAYFAYHVEELRYALESADPEAPVARIVPTAAPLASRIVALADVARDASAGLTGARPRSARRAVVVEDGQPVGVIPAVEDIPDLAQLLSMATSTRITTYAAGESLGMAEEAASSKRGLPAPKKALAEKAGGSARRPGLVYFRSTGGTPPRRTLAPSLEGDADTPPPRPKVVILDGFIPGPGGWPDGAVPEPPSHTPRSGKKAAAKQAAPKAAPARRKATRSETRTASTRSTPRAAPAVPPGKRKTRTAEAATVVCEFHARMPDVVPAGREADVVVKVSREAIREAIGRAAAAGTSPVDPSRSIELFLIPRLNFETVGETRALIDPPDPDEPASVTFRVRATRPAGDGNEGEVMVLAFQAQTRLVSLFLRPTIVGAGGGRKAIAAAAKVAEAPRATKPHHTLIINLVQNGHEEYYNYCLTCSDPVLYRKSRSSPLEKGRKAFVSARFQEIEDAWEDSFSDGSVFTERLRAFGGDLWDRLFDEPFRTAIWEHRDEIRSVLVFSDEPFIPWELVHMKQPDGSLPDEAMFLGQKGLVRWDWTAKGPPLTLEIRKGRARYVAPDYQADELKLPMLAREAGYLKKAFGATPIEAMAGPVLAQLRSRGAFDLLHFVCHGEADVDRISNPRLILRERSVGGQMVNDSLDETLVGQFGKLQAEDGTQAIVVVNACQSGRPGRAISGIGGFAQAFLKAGAGAFVGALWAIGDDAGFTFIRAFYEALRRGKSLSEATVDGREAARKDDCSTWMAFVVYGHPHARLAGANRPADES